MLTDFHCHVLPFIDDGAKDVDTSIAMLNMLLSQRVLRVIATPHFYAHKFDSVNDFIVKRQASYDAIKPLSPYKDNCFYLAAEVAIEHGISSLIDIDKLVISRTNLILLELPYSGFENWMLDEINNIAIKYNLKVIIAHVHRYLDLYSDSDMQKILDNNFIFQINIEAFKNPKHRKFVKTLIKDDYPLIFGSDAHNILDRKPNFLLLKKKVKPIVIESSNATMDHHFIRQFLF